MILQSESLSAFAHPGVGIFPPMSEPPFGPYLPGRGETTIAPKPDARLEVPIDELSFRHLQSAADIARIVPLRQQIQLPASAMADPAFHTREKKETRRAS